MKIENYNYSTTFMARYLPQELLNNINRLKTRMECDTIILKGREINQIISTRGLSINHGEAIFKDGKFLAKRDKKTEKLVPYGKDTAMVEFGKVRLITDGNGEIIEHKKPFYTKWSNIIEKFDNYIKYALDNYNDNNVVEKLHCKKEVLTNTGKKQANKIVDIFNSINPFTK